MKTWILIMLATAACLIGGAPASYGQERSRPSEAGVPKKFKLWIGGITGRSYWVDWDGKALKYQTADSNGPSEPHMTEIISPTFEQWQEFWKAMDGVELWRWRSKYENRDIVCGTSWGVQIQQAGRYGKKRRSWGTNSYPRTDDVTKEVKTGEPSTVFKAFNAAVEALLGNRPYG